MFQALGAGMGDLNEGGMDTPEEEEEGIDHLNDQTFGDGTLGMMTGVISNKIIYCLAFTTVLLNTLMLQCQI